jgi:hypothetical protein
VCVCVCVCVCACVRDGALKMDLLGALGRQRPELARATLTDDMDEVSRTDDGWLRRTAHVF